MSHDSSGLSAEFCLASMTFQEAALQPSSSETDLTRQSFFESSQRYAVGLPVVCCRLSTGTFVVEVQFVLRSLVDI